MVHHEKTAFVSYVIVLLVFLLFSGISAFDKRQSTFWKNCLAGKTQRLILTGTSLSNPAHSPWPDSLKAVMNSKMGPGIFDMRNISPDGGNTSMEGANCADSVVKIINLAPNAVFIEFASNDATNHYDCTIGACSKPSHIKMIEAIRKSLPSCEIFLYVTGLPFDKMSCESVACAYCTVFEAQYCRRAARPSSTDSVEKYFDMVRALADIYNVHLIDTYWDFKAVHDRNPSQYVNYLYDGHHPTPLATHEIIIPHMIRALKGWPIVVTGPHAGDTISAGDSITVTWEYDPDSVEVVDINMSSDGGKTWLPGINKSIDASKKIARILVPKQIGGYSMVSDSFYILVRKYDSYITDRAGPIVVKSALSISHKTFQSARKIHEAIFCSLEKINLEIFQNGTAYTIMGKKIRSKQGHILN